MRWCPSPGCNLAVKANHLLAYRQNCTCLCGHRFCFSCGDEPHDPIPCHLIESWKKNDNDKTIEYLTKFTKCCPKCNSLIEKNGGCNHMVSFNQTISTQCFPIFLWNYIFVFNSSYFRRVASVHMNFVGCVLVIGKVMVAVAIHTNPLKTVKMIRNGNLKIKLIWLIWLTKLNCFSFFLRWEHYFKRYGVHKKSLKTELTLVDSAITNKMTEMQAMGKSWNDVSRMKTYFSMTHFYIEKYQFSLGSILNESG